MQKRLRDGRCRSDEEIADGGLSEYRVTVSVPVSESHLPIGAMVVGVVFVTEGL